MNKSKLHVTLPVISTGVDFTELLTLLFIGLKLGSVISWPWWICLSPLLLPVTCAALCYGAAYLIDLSN